MMSHIVDSGFDVNSYSPSGDTPLHVAVKRDQYEAAKWLIDHGANVNQSVKCNASIHKIYPVHLAARCFSKKMLKLLLDSGADINTLNSEGETALDIITKEYTYRGFSALSLESEHNRQLECKIFIEQCGGKHGGELMSQKHNVSCKCDI